MRRQADKPNPLIPRVRVVPVPDSSRRWLAIVCVAAVLACGDDPASTDPICTQEIPVGVGASVGGRLTGTDRRFAGAPIDYYALQIVDSVQLRVEQSSTDLDPLLIVFNVDLEVLAQAFDTVGAPAGSEETASLTYPFGPGCHLLGASSWETDATGSYILMVEEP